MVEIGADAEIVVALIWELVSIFTLNNDSDPIGSFDKFPDDFFCGEEFDIQSGSPVGLGEGHFEFDGDIEARDSEVIDDGVFLRLLGSHIDIGMPVLIEQIEEVIFFMSQMFCHTFV